MIILSNFRLAIVFCLFFILGGCALPKTQVSSLDRVGNDEVIVFGKLRLEPKIQKDEVSHSGMINLSKRDLHETLFMKASDAFYDLHGGHAMDHQGSFVVYDDEYYFFSWKKDSPFHILGVSFITRWTSRERETVTLRIKEGVKVNHSGKSKAVYVGNITFVRDEFFNIKDLKVDQSGYDEAKKEFQKRFNQTWPTEKAKLSPSR